MDDLAKEQERDLWRSSAHARSRKSCSGHEWMPVSWRITARSKHVTTIMCTRCFHEVVISEAYANRD